MTGETGAMGWVGHIRQVGQVGEPRVARLGSAAAAATDVTAAKYEQLLDEIADLYEVCLRLRRTHLEKLQERLAAGDRDGAAALPEVRTFGIEHGVALASLPPAPLPLTPTPGAALAGPDEAAPAGAIGAIGPAGPAGPASTVRAMRTQPPLRLQRGRRALSQRGVAMGMSRLAPAAPPVSPAPAARPALRLITGGRP